MTSVSVYSGYHSLNDSQSNFNHFTSIDGIRRQLFWHCSVKADLFVILEFVVSLDGIFIVLLLV